MQQACFAAHNYFRARMTLAAYLEPQVQHPVALDDHVGILQHVLPADQVLAEAQRLAAVIASRSPYSLRAIKEQVRLDAARSWEEGYLDMRERLVACLDEPDFAEAMAAQRAKRAPDFRREVT